MDKKNENMIDQKEGGRTKPFSCVYTTVAMYYNLNINTTMV